jgi:hypothetical protein
VCGDELAQQLQRSERLGGEAATAVHAREPGLRSTQLHAQTRECDAGDETRWRSSRIGRGVGCCEMEDMNTATATTRQQRCW